MKSTSHFWTDLPRTLREPWFLVFGYLVPFLSFFVCAGAFHMGMGAGVAYFTGAALAAGILGNGLWGTRTTGMGGACLLFLPVAVALIALAHIRYAMPLPHDWISLVLLLALGICALHAAGLVLATLSTTLRGAVIAILLFYLLQFFITGVTIPAIRLPSWAQALAEFFPAASLVSSLQGILFASQSVWDTFLTAIALLGCALLGTFFEARAAQRTKQGTLAPFDRLAILAVLAPFLLMGAYRTYHQDHIARNRALFRDLQRSGTFLIRNTRVFSGDGKVLENASVLVRDGRIAAILEGAAADADALQAEVVEGAGKTLLPGLVDAQVRLSSPAGMAAAAAALLANGIVAARSAGDNLRDSLALRDRIAAGSYLGAQLFVSGPVFTVANGSGIDHNLPASTRGAPQAILTPKTPEEARRQVRELKAKGVDGIKAILEAGWGDGMLIDRLDLLLVRSVAEEARAQKLTLATHTGDARDVTDAAEIGAISIEHGSWHDQIPDAVLERMARQGNYLDPSLGAAEAYAQYFAGKGADPARAILFQSGLECARADLLRAWKAGVPLVMGSDAGNSMVFHGPSLHHELQLWVNAGIPPAVALTAVTANGAKLLGADGRFGAIRPGLEADLLLVDGNPLVDISATSRIQLVIFKGERLRLSPLGIEQ